MSSLKSKGFSHWEHQCGQQIVYDYDYDKCCVQNVRFGLKVEQEEVS